MARSLRQSGTLKTAPEGLDAVKAQVGADLVGALLANATTVRPYGVHRCGGNVFPEQTFEAASGSMALGDSGLILDADANLLSDGAVGLMHDNTVDRTTTATGATSAYSTQQWLLLRSDAGNWFAPGWPNDLRVPLVGEFLDRFGGKVAIEIEAKTTSVVAPLIKEITRRGLQKSCIIVTQIIADLATIKAAGIRALYYFPAAVDASNSTLRAQVFAAAPDLIAIQAGTNPTDAAIIVATGIPVVAGVLRQVDVAPALALGATVLGSDEPAYTLNKHTKRTTDSWASKTFGHGFLTNLSVRSTFVDVAGRGPGIQLPAGAFVQQSLGEFCPTPNTSITVDVWVTMPTLPTDLTRLLQVTIVDSDVQASSAAVAYNGYGINFRADGQIFIFRVNKTANTTTQIASKTNAPVTAPAAGESRHLRVQITSTTITATDVTTGAVATATDSTFRPSGGWYLSLLKVDATLVGVWQADTLSVV